MSKKNWLILFAVLLIGGIVGVIYYVKPFKPRTATDPYLSLLKLRCEVFKESPYYDSELNFSIEFTKDRIVCLLKDDIEGTREIYIWQKDAFESEAINTPLQDAILGKIAINSQDVEDVNVVESFTTNIDSESVTGEIVLPKNCSTASCPRAKRVVLQRFGKKFRIEEYDESLNLFGDIHFESE